MPPSVLKSTSSMSTVRPAVHRVLRRLDEKAQGQAGQDRTPQARLTAREDEEEAEGDEHQRVRQLQPQNHVAFRVAHPERAHAAAPQSFARQPDDVALPATAQRLVGEQGRRQHDQETEHQQSAREHRDDLPGAGLQRHRRPGQDGAQQQEPRDGQRGQAEDDLPHGGGSLGRCRGRRGSTTSGGSATW